MPARYRNWSGHWRQKALMIQINDIVLYKGRRWLVIDLSNKKPTLVLLPGQKPIIRGIEEFRIVSPNISSVSKLNENDNLPR